MSDLAPIHHPNAALLNAAAAGTLSPAVSRIVGAHASLCTRCRDLMNRIETVGGAQFELDDGVAVDETALTDALALLGAQEPDPALPESLASLPRQVRDVVAAAIGKSSWRYGGPGLKILDLVLPQTADGETFQVFRIEPGYGPPRHTHGGQEFTLVLTGAFKDETGLYAVGDLEIGDQSVTHHPIAQPGEVCFALAVTTAPLQFKGPLGVLQRVMNFGRRG